MQEIEKITKLFGVVGYPLGHSLSPLLHNWGFYKCDLQHTYFKWQIPHSDLGAFIVSMYTLPIHGASVTIPYKRTVIPYLDDITQEARDIGAVNTLYWENNELYGENTDWQGFLQPLINMGIEAQSALILGAGGAALSSIVGLQKLGVSEIFVAARKRHILHDLEARFGIKPVDWENKELYEADLLVNTTPFGMAGGEYQSLSPFDGSLKGFNHVYDLVYNPLQTKLIQQATTEHDCTVISGLHMFIYQALRQFQTWTGCVFPIEEAEAKLKQCL